MKARIVFAADGTQNMLIKGFSISTQLFKKGRGGALIHVYNKKGHETRTYHFNKVHLIERIR